MEWSGSPTHKETEKQEQDQEQNQEKKENQEQDTERGNSSGLETLNDRHIKETVEQKLVMTFYPKKKVPEFMFAIFAPNLLVQK